MVSFYNSSNIFNIHVSWQENYVAVLLCFLGRSLDIALAKSEIDLVRQKLLEYRERVDTYHTAWYEEALSLAVSLDITESKPRTCARMQHRSNIPAEDPSTYYKRVVTIPTLGMCLCDCVYCVVFFDNLNFSNP